MYKVISPHFGWLLRLRARCHRNGGHHVLGTSPRRYRALIELNLSLPGDGEHLRRIFCACHAWFEVVATMERSLRRVTLGARVQDART